MDSPRPYSHLDFNPLGDHMITAHNLTLTYDRRAVIHHLHFKLENEKTLAILGGNGSGKTTLLKALAGILPVDEGQLLNGFDKTQRGYLPQQHQVDLSLPITLKELVSMGLLAKTGAFQKPRKEQITQVQATLDRLQLTSLQHLPIKSLSGGQMQRALWARLIVLDPELILLDEPFNHLDEPALKLVLQVLLDWKKQKKTIVIVLHDKLLAEKLADQTLTLISQNMSTHANPTLCLNDLAGV